MTADKWLLAILATGLGSYFLRISPFLWRRCYEWGLANERLLTYTSFAIAAGIVSRVVFVNEAELVMNADVVVKCIAIGLALLLNHWVRNIPIALFSGVACAVFLKWVVGG